jgi:platelet-activating factor acetylhydrolase IB subunit beta/gamma
MKEAPSPTGRPEREAPSAARRDLTENKGRLSGAADPIRKRQRMEPERMSARPTSAASRKVGSIGNPGRTSGRNAPSPAANPEETAPYSKAASKSGMGSRLSAVRAAGSQWIQKGKNMSLQAVGRTDDHHMAKHARILAIIKTQKIQAVFLGDSLIRRWEDNIDLWNHFFSGFDAVNFGVGSDCLENIKWRILNGELEGIAPRVILVLAGTNNLGKDPAGTIVDGIVEIADIIRRKLPHAKIVILGLLPRNADGSGLDYSALIGEINGRIRGRLEGTDIVFRDIGADLAGGDGKVDETIMPDGLHLNRAGYEVIGPRIKSILEELWPG